MIRLKESIKRAKERGRIGKKFDFAQEMWKGSSAKSAYMNLFNLENERSKKIDIEIIPIICKTLGVSADYLFGLSDVPNIEEVVSPIKEEIIANAEAVIAKVKEL